jgi:hypothetical protein
MTEQEWLACDDPQTMLNYWGTNATNRKLRLFGCACCRRAWDLIEDPRLWEAIETLERVADRTVKDKERVRVSRISLEIAQGSPNQRHALVGWELFAISRRVIRPAVDRPGEDVAGAFAPSAQRKLLFKEKRRERQRQTVVLRHIFGNPFRPYPAPPSWPATVVQLAESLYAGQDCAFALHDALLEAGHAELAEHFRQETWHPKGCWVVDLILGKQ